MENPPPPPYTPIDPLTPPTPTSDSSFESNMTIPPIMPSLRGGFIRPVEEETGAGFSSAALYFDERPFTFIPPSTFVSHGLPISPYTTREDMQLPDHFEVWRARDVAEQDWATFVNYVLAEIHAGPDEKGHESTASATQDFLESRQKIEAVIAEWNEGFFGPRRICITPVFSFSTSARIPSPSPSYRTIPTAVPFSAPQLAPHLGRAFPSSVNHQALVQPMHHIGRFPSRIAPVGHPPGFPFPPSRGSSVLLTTQYQGCPVTQPNLSVHNGDPSHQPVEQHGRNDRPDAQNSSDHHNHYAHHHHPYQHGNGPLGNHRGRHRHHGNVHGGRHRRRSESTSSSSSSSSDSSISSISSRDLEGVDPNDIRQSLAAFLLDPTKKDHIRTAVRQLHCELRSHQRSDQRERKGQSREVRTETRNQKRTIRNEVRSLMKEAKSIRRSKKRERKAEKRCRKAQLKAQNSGNNSGMWGWRQQGGPSARSVNDGRCRSFEPTTENLGSGGQALHGQSRGVSIQHDLEREAAARERRAEELSIQLDREAEEREMKLEAEARGRGKEAEERERRLGRQAKERERQAEERELQLERQAEERERQAEERELQLGRQAEERERQAEERERQLQLKQEAGDHQLEKSEFQRAEQLEKAAEQRAKQAEQRIKQLRKAAEQRQKQEDQRVRELEKAAEKREKEVTKLKQQSDARARQLQQEAENLRSEAAQRKEAAAQSTYLETPTGAAAVEASISPGISLSDRARTLSEQARTLSVNNTEATARGLTAGTHRLSRTVSQSAEETARGWGMRGEELGRELGMRGEELGRGMQARGEEFGRGMQARGEDFGRGMEEWGARFGRRMEGWGGRVGR